MDWSTNDIPVFVYAEMTWNSENLEKKFIHCSSSRHGARTTLVRDWNAGWEEQNFVSTSGETYMTQ